MNMVYEKLQACLADIRQNTDFVPDVALVLGSGLGALAERVQPACSIRYNDIKGFPVSTVQGHAGEYVFGTLNGVNVALMNGRVHYYEGYEISDVVLPVRLLGLMGAKILFLTNASGGVNTDFKAGDFMLIKDHVSSFMPSPLRGPNMDALGTRFPDMTHIYEPQLSDCVRRAARDLGIPLKEGVYVQFSGPAYESPAEINMARAIGGDAVGMSTAVEAVAARHMGMRVVGVSVVSNLAAGIAKHPLTHEEVKEAGAKAAPAFRRLVEESVARMAELL